MSSPTDKLYKATIPVAGSVSFFIRASNADEAKILAFDKASAVGDQFNYSVNDALREQPHVLLQVFRYAPLGETFPRYASIEEIEEPVEDVAKSAP